MPTIKRAVIPRPKILSEASKAEIIKLRGSLAAIQQVENLRHSVDCEKCAKLFRDAAERATIKVLIEERIEQLNRSAA